MYAPNTQPSKRCRVAFLLLTAPPPWCTTHPPGIIASRLPHCQPTPLIKSPTIACTRYLHSLLNMIQGHPLPLLSLLYLQDQNFRLKKWKTDLVGQVDHPLSLSPSARLCQFKKNLQSVCWLKCKNLAQSVK